MFGQTVFILWRESVEALLVIGILNSWINQGGERVEARRYLWGGVAAGIFAAILLALGLTGAGAILEGERLEYFQAGLLFAAGGLILHMVLWMRRHGGRMKRDLHEGLDEAAQDGHFWAVFLLAAIAVAREGSETVVFLSGVLTGASSANALPLSGAALLGFALAVLTYGALQFGGRLLSWRLFFRVSTALLLLLACAIFVNAVGILVSLGILPYMDPLWDTSWLLDDMGSVGGLVASLTGYRSQPDIVILATWVVYWAAVYGLLRWQGHQTARLAEARQ